MAATLKSFPCCLLASAIPRAADIEVDAWPAPITSYSLSERFKKPLRPSSMQLQNNGRNFPPNYLHETWRDYLYWDTELEN